MEDVSKTVKEDLEDIKDDLEQAAKEHLSAEELSSQEAKEEASYASVPKASKGSSRHGFLGGVCASALVLGVVGALQWFHVIPGSLTANPDVQKDVSNLKTMLNTLSQQVQNHSNAPQTAPNSAQESALANQVKNLQEELQKLGQQTQLLQQKEQTMTRQNAGNADVSAFTKSIEDLKKRLQNAENSLKNVNDVKQNVEKVLTNNQQTQTALQQQIEANKALNARLAAKEKQAQMTQEEQNLLLLTQNLQQAVQSGHPFSSLLALLKKHFPNLTTKFLSQYAATGLPSPEALANEVAGVGDKIVQNADEPPLSQNGVISILLNQLRRIIAVRPQGAVTGNTIEAIVARIEDAVKKGQYDVALKELGNLPAHSKAIAAEFMAKLKAYSEMQNCVDQTISSAAKVPESTEAAPVHSAAKP